ncbi:MAG: hypothetical protein GX537_08525, partial [Actinobacteria bacterium]|nr:hypothetical protein [Actinomycetota bacterium]
MNLEWLGIDLEKMSHNPLVRGLTEVVAAVTDGLAIQVGLGIQSDLSEAMQALEVMVRAVVAQIEAAPLDEA